MFFGISVKSLWLKGATKWFGKQKVEIVEDVGDVRFFGTKDLSRSVSLGEGSVKGLQMEPLEASKRV